MKRIWAFLLVAVMLFSAEGGMAQDAGEGEATKVFGFAERLFEEGDYYRAITEYKRFIFLFPESEYTEKSFFRIGESYFRAKKWKEAIESFDLFVKKFPRSLLRDEALYHQGIAEKNLKSHSEALSIFESLAARSCGDLRDRAIVQSALVLVETADYSGAITKLSLIPAESPLSESARSFSEGLVRVESLPQKSPEAAGVLAALVPGSGHLYTERPRDALVAFLLNGAFIWAAIELFDHRDYVLGGIVTFIELGWYTGNIYSAVSSAHKYNERTREDYIDTLKKKSGFNCSFNRDGGFILYSLRY